MFDILQITKPKEYFKQLEVIRQRKNDFVFDTADPLNLHRVHVPALPSYIKAEGAANKGDIYCFWCASNHVVKNGHKDKRLELYSFTCKDCNSSFSYKMPQAVYNAFNGYKMMKKGKYKPRKK